MSASELNYQGNAEKAFKGASMQPDAEQKSQVSWGCEEELVRLMHQACAQNVFQMKLWIKKKKRQQS